MEGTEHEKTFFYRHKVVVINLLLMAIILGVDPDLLSRLPNTAAADYYTGVFIIFLLFVEFSGIWYKAQAIFSFSSATYQKVPAFLSGTFVPRVLASGAIAILAVDAMGGFKVSDFFLVPIVLYAAVKEFWVRSVLFNTERERHARPGAVRMALGDILLFVFILGAYFSCWKVYLLESPRIMFMVLSPINWGFAAAAFALILYCMQMPWFWEDHLKSKTRGQKTMGYLSLLLPVIGLLGRFYLQSYLRA